MREIKFRCWDGKKFGYVQIQANLISWPTNMWTESKDVSGEGRRFVDVMDWQQFTGLRDKNGREIYEGDLLRREGFDSVWEVVWWVDGFYRRNSNAGHAHIDELQEVIGNRYESPELLK